jgi:deoxyguanosine kinase
LAKAVVLIVIEGCVGAGKSTVVEGLAANRGSKALLENFEANPFLRAFYKDPIKHATETEFAFLLPHFHQLKNHAAASTESEVIAGCHLGKDLIYAELKLLAFAADAVSYGI